MMFGGGRPRTKSESTPNEDPRVKSHRGEVPISRSPGKVCDVWIRCKTLNRSFEREFLPLSWPGSRFRGFQPSTLTSSEPQSFPLAPLYQIMPQTYCWTSMRSSHSRVEIPYHYNGVITPAGEPPTGKCPSDCENWAGVHREGR